MPKKKRRVAATRRPPRSRPPAAAVPPALRSAQQLRDQDVERMLATGERRGLLEDYFGPELERELAELARESLRQPLRGGPRVWILPGIMGSSLGRRRNGSPDLIWIDPLDIARGRLLSLALPDAGSIVPCGVILYAYLKLKLRLRLAGFDADFAPFDWRRSVRELGAELADRLEAASGKVHLVAHSMGGLVARAALGRPRASRKIASVVMLGTPNHGSFAPVQAIRGSYPLVRKVAALDLAHSPEDLARRLFATFPGLHDMLPRPERWSGVDLYDAASWPSDAPAPRQPMLDAARAAQRALPEPAEDERLSLIAGVDQETTVGVSWSDGEVRYELGREGDGTVPLALALLRGIRTYYVEEAHGSLPNNGAVTDAVIDLLQDGQTSRLPSTWAPAPSRRAVRSVRESELPQDPIAQRAPGSWSTRDTRQLADELVSARSRDAGPLPAAAPAPAEAAPAPGFQHSLRDVEVTRRRAHSIEICLAQGSITEAPAHALTLGIFQGVDPAGAARAVDERMRGVVREFLARRMLAAEVGAVSVLPTGRHLLHADSVLFVGLGSFDGFRDDVQQFVAENVVRTFVRTNVEDFATVLFGAGSGWSVQSLLYNQLRGFVRGLLDADRSHRMRRVTICETNPERFQEMKEELYRLASTELFGELVVTFDEARLPDPPALPDGGARRGPPLRDHAYLVVNREERADTKQVFRSAVLTAGGRAAVVAGVREVEDAALDALLKRIESRGFTAAKLSAFGNELAALVLDPTVAEVLGQQRDCHLVVVHDAVSSRIPWETLCIDDWSPAAERGLSRRYAAQDLSVAKWLEERRLGEILELLLVTNPTADLDGAEREAKRLKALFPSGSAVRIDEVAREKATRTELLARLRSGRYDVVHYAGHAFFDPEAPARSGILCHGDQVLSGAHLAELAQLPSLVFFNACEAGRIRTPKLRRQRSLDVQRRVDRSIGLAEAFLRGGVANYVGTYWPVGDDSAETFATTFYGRLVAGEPIGDALQAGRQAVRQLASVDWADYIHYGTYDFAMKRGE